MRKAVKLKFLCSSFSTPITQDEITNEGPYPVFGASGIVGYKEVFSCESPFLGIIKDGAGVGRITRYDGKSSLLGTLAYIIPNPSVDINWLMYAVMGLDLGKDISSTTIPHIYFKDYGNRHVALFSLNEQRRIAAYLDAECARIDSIIEKARASIEEYKKLKQSVITEAVTKGIRKGRAMKESGIAWIGEIPEEWEIRPLKAYIDILPGYAFPSGNFDVENGVRLLRGINVAPDSIRWDETVYWNQPINEPIKPFELFENDLVVGLDRPWISEGTRVAFVTKKDLPCLLLQRVCRIRPKAGVDIRFVYHAIAGKMFEEALSTDTTGVSVPHISTKQIQNYLIAVPPIQEQKEICAFLANQSCAIDGLLARKQSLISALETYKKSLIYETVTGKKEVPA